MYLLPFYQMPESTAVERIDSGITDESPFGSSLTTPVDEDVQLFPGIEERLLKSRIDLLGSAELATHVGSPNGLSEYSNSLSEAACKTLEFSQGILSRDKVREFLAWGMALTHHTVIRNRNARINTYALSFPN